MARGGGARLGQTGLPVEIFRLAGIYGPGRSVLDRLRAGRAQRMVKPGQVFSRIHVDDIGAALAAAMARPRPGRVLNVADDLPAPPEEVIAFAAELLGMPALPPEIALEAAELTPMARSFWDELKRVANRRLRDELGLALRWPDYRAGLRGDPRRRRLRDAGNSVAEINGRRRSGLAFGGRICEDSGKVGKRAPAGAG